MFSTAKSRADRNLLLAIDNSLAMITFSPDGTILSANDNFLAAMGYAADEVVGKHHRMFVLPEEAASDAYAALWADLRAGTPRTGEFRRIGKRGQDVWIRAAYTPVKDASGAVTGVVKLASDVTADKLLALDAASQLQAIDRSQAVIEFKPDGTILAMNANFLAAMGYSERELVGQHHRLFMPAEDAASPEYRAFWQDLARGEHKSGQVRRVAKGGREIWLQATYTPVLDWRGTVLKVIKLATDITETKRLSQQRAAQRQIETDLVEIAASIDQVTNEATSAADRSSQTSDKVRSLSSATQDLAASVQEISRQVSTASQVSDDAVAQSNQTREAVSSLTSAAQKIGEVVSLINDIAEQTNLLALNATIEAARAGDAGKGFAVVAGEVKSLAAQTSKATGEISDQIAEVQRATGEAAEAITGIGATIGRISEISSAIAGAVEEQSALTKDMSEGMAGAVDDVTEIHSRLTEVASANRAIEQRTVSIRDASLKIG